jgi:hypothetical protein
MILLSGMSRLVDVLGSVEVLQLVEVLQSVEALLRLEVLQLVEVLLRLLGARQNLPELHKRLELLQKLREELLKLPVPLRQLEHNQQPPRHQRRQVQEVLAVRQTK